jgi:serine/threonine protein kinase
MPLVPGTKLGPYEIESLIGAGGMGEVYKARDPRLHRTVAIRCIIAEDKTRFQSEARHPAMNHPHICQIYDIGPDYFVLEYLEGEQLRGPVAPREAVRLASPIADALQAAHERGILQRDLKPANVIVVQQGGIRANSRERWAKIEVAIGATIGCDRATKHIAATTLSGTPSFQAFLDSFNKAASADRAIVFTVDL